MTNINLLPPNYQRLLRVERFFPVVGWLAVMTALTVGGTFGLALGQRWQLNRTIDRLTSQKEESQKAVASFDAVAEQTKTLAANVSEYNKIAGQQLVWSSFFSYLENTLPPDVTLVSVASSVEQGAYKLNVTGRAASRTAVGLWREKLLAYQEVATAPARISQIVISSVGLDAANGQQNFTLLITMDLNPNGA